MTDGELHSILNEIRINPDPTPYTFASLGEELTRRGYPGSDIRSQVAYTMLQIELKEKILPVEYEKVRGDIKAAYIAMSATKEGLSLHTTERQQLIGLLAQVGNWQPGVMEAVLSLGVSQTKLFECTLEQVSTEKAAILLYNLKRSKQQAAANRYNIYIDAIEAWDGSGEEPVL
jgi:hypothetical protein